MATKETKKYTPLSKNRNSRLDSLPFNSFSFCSCCLRLFSICSTPWNMSLEFSSLSAGSIRLLYDSFVPAIWEFRLKFRSRSAIWIFLLVFSIFSEAYCKLFSILANISFCFFRFLLCSSCRLIESCYFSISSIKSKTLSASWPYSLVGASAILLLNWRRF